MTAGMTAGRSSLKATTRKAESPAATATTARPTSATSTTTAHWKDFKIASYCHRRAIFYAARSW